MRQGEIELLAEVVVPGGQYVQLAARAKLNVPAGHVPVGADAPGVKQ